MPASYITSDKVKQLKAKLDLNGTAILDGSSITASTVIIADTSKNIISSGTSTTELSYLVGVTGSLQTQITAATYAYDIKPATASIANNTASPTNISGLSFSSASVRSARVQYHIYLNSSTSSLIEAGSFELAYRSSTTGWDVINRAYGGDTTGVTLTATTAGAVQYTSPNIGGSSYSGVIAFRASALPA